MSTYAYQEILHRFQQLSSEEQLRLLKDLTAITRSDEKEQGLHDIMEFWGFAKESWKGVDIEKYINEERNSWDG